MLGTAITVGESAAQTGAYISFGTSAEVRTSLNFPDEIAAMAARSAAITESDMNAVGEQGLVEFIVLRNSSADSADFAWSGPVDANDLGYRRSDQPAQSFTFNVGGMLQIRGFTTGTAPAADLQLKNDAVVESDETITITLTSAGGGEIDPARAALTLTIIDDDEFAEAPDPSAGFSPVADNQPVGIRGGSVSFNINLQNYFPTNVDDTIVSDVAVDVRMMGDADSELSDIVNGVESEDYQIKIDDPDTVNPVGIRSGAAGPGNTATFQTFSLIIPINRFFESSGSFGAATIPLTLTTTDILAPGETIEAFINNVYFRGTLGQLNATLPAQGSSSRLTTYTGQLIATLSPDPEDLARGIRVNGGTARFGVDLGGIPETVEAGTVGGVFFTMNLAGSADNVASLLAMGAGIQTADYSITLDDAGSGGSETARVEPASVNNMRLQIIASRDYLIARDERLSFTIAALAGADPDTTIRLQLHNITLIDPSQAALVNSLVSRSAEPVEWDITPEPGAVVEVIDRTAVEPASGGSATNFGVFTITLENLPPLLSGTDSRRFLFNTGSADSTLSDATPGYGPAEAGITPATTSPVAPDEYIFLYIPPDGEPLTFGFQLNGASEGRIHNVLVPKTPDETYTFRIVPNDDLIADDNERVLFGYRVSFGTGDSRDLITGRVNNAADSVVIRDSSEAVLSAALTITDGTLAEQAGAGADGEESTFELVINNLHTDGPDNVSVFYQLQGLATPVGSSDAEATDLAVSGAEGSFDPSGEGVANLNRGTHINSGGDAVIRFTVSVPGDDGNPADESIRLLINCISHAPRGDIPGRGVLMGSAGCDAGSDIDVLLPGESVTGNGAAVTAQDNEFGIVLSVSDPAADERNETAGEFTVALHNFNPAANADIALTYELGGTATSPDYTISVADAAHDPRTRTITIPAANIAGAGGGAQGNAAGNAVATIGITPVNDRIDEDDETVTLSITSAPAGALVVPRETDPITIADDDLFSAALTVTDDTLVEQAAQGAEGASGSFQLTINNLPTDGADNISIFYQVQGLATEIGFSGQPTILSTSTTTSAPLSGELNPGGEGRIDISLRSRVVTITYFLRVAGDDGNLEDESISLLINCISRSTRGSLTGSAGCDLGNSGVIEVLLPGASVTGNAAAIIVLDDDIVSDFGVALSTSDPNAAEADQDIGEFTVVLSDFDTVRNFNARLTYELGGTVAPSDYAISVAGAAHDAGANTITIPGENIEGIGAGPQGNAAGAAVATIVITPVDDRIDEDEETVTFSIIASAPASTPLISSTTAPVRITDNDTAAAAITALDNLALEPLTAEEEAVDFGVFTITLDTLSEAQLATNVRRFFFNPGHNDHDDPVDDLNDTPGYGPPPPGVVPATEDDFIIEYIPPVGDPVAVSPLYPSSGGNGVTIHGTGDIAKISDEIYTFRVSAVHDADDDSNEVLIFGYRVDFATGNDNDQIRGIEDDRNDNAVNIRQFIPYISFGTSAQVRASLNFPDEVTAMAARSATITESDMNAVSGLVEFIVLRNSFSDSADFAWSGAVDANDLGYRRSDQPAQPFIFNANGILQIRGFTAGTAAAADLQLKDDAVVEPDETITITLTAAGGDLIDPARATLTLIIIDDDEFAEVPAPSAGFSPVADNQSVGIRGGSVSFSINLQNYFPTNVDDIIVSDVAVDVRMMGSADNELSDIVNGVESEDYQIKIDDPDTVNPVGIRSGAAGPGNTATFQTFSLIIPINRFFESSGSFGAATIPLTLTTTDILAPGETIEAFINNVYFRGTLGQLNATLPAQGPPNRLTTYTGQLIATLFPNPEDLARGIRGNGDTVRFDVDLKDISETVGAGTVGGVFLTMNLGGTADNVASPLAAGVSIQTEDYSITLDDAGSGGNETARVEPASGNNMRLQIRASRDYLIARDERISFTIAALAGADPDTTIRLQLHNITLIDPSRAALPNSSSFISRSEEPVEWDITQPRAVVEVIDGVAIEPVSGVAATDFGVFTITLKNLPLPLSDANTRRFVFNTGPNDSTGSIRGIPGYSPAQTGIIPATASSAAPDEYIFLYIPPDGEPLGFLPLHNGTSEGRLFSRFPPKTPDETYTFRIVPNSDSIADDNERALFGYRVTFGNGVVFLSSGSLPGRITGKVNRAADSVVIRDLSEAALSAALTVTDDTLGEQAAGRTEGEYGIFRLTINNLPADSDDNISVFYQVQGLATMIGLGEPVELLVPTGEGTAFPGALNATGAGRTDIGADRINTGEEETIAYFLLLPEDDSNLEDESISLLINCISRSTRVSLVGSAGCDSDSPDVIEVLLRGESVTGNGAAIIALDNDIAVNFGVALSTSDPNAAETDQDTGEFTVALSDFDTVRNFNARLTYELGGTAAPSDYAISVAGAAHDAGANTITIPGENIEGSGAGVQGNAAGAAVATIVITPVDDRLNEDEETVTFSIIASMPISTPPISATTTSVRIADNDIAAAAITALDNLALEPLTAEEEAADFGVFTITLASLTEAQLATNIRRFFFNPGYNDHDDPVDDLNDMPGYGPPPPGVVPATEDDFIIEYIPPTGDPVAVQSLYPSSGGNEVTIHGTGDIAKISSEIYTFRVTAVHDADDDSNEVLIFGYRVDFATGDDNDQIRGIEDDRDDNAVNIRQIIPSICGRTPQVSDAIVAAVNALPAYNDVTCDRVTTGQLGEVVSLTVDGNGAAVPVANLRLDDFADLPALNSLTISNHPGLGSLRAGVFDNLPSLLILRLNDNGLNRLPDGVFDGQGNLRLLSLENNPGLTLLRDGLLDPVLDTLVTVVLDDALVSEISFSGSLNNIETDSVATIDVTRTAPHATLAVPISLTSGDAENIVVGDGSGFVVLAAGVSSTAVEIRVAPEADLDSGFTLALGTPSPPGIARIPPGGVISFSVGNICTRTPQVRDAILDKISGISDCALVTRQHLNDITEALNLNSMGINTLQTEDFKHLAALEELNLSDNNLSALPADVFNELDVLDRLSIAGNAGLTELPAGVLDPVLDTVTNLTLSNTLTDRIFFEHAEGAVRRDGSTAIRVIRTQPHTTVTVAINTGGSLSGRTMAPAEITFPAGATSVTFIVRIDRFAFVSNDAVTLILGALSLPADTRVPPNAAIVSSVAVVADTNNVHTLDILPSDGICGRTQQVQAAIVDVLGVACEAVTENALSGLTGTLDLNGRGISTLQTGDFDSLTGLTTLDLGDNDLEALPAGLSDDLPSLMVLDLDGNNLSPLPDDLFDGLTGLMELRLGENSLSTLPSTVFSDLLNLGALHLQENSLVTLPNGLFDSLTGLTTLDLGDNDLEALPGGLSDDLPSLMVLDLDGNNLSPLPDDLFDGLTGLTELRLGENSLSTLPSTVFSDLPNLGALHLQENSLVTLPDDLFDGLTGLTTLDLGDNDLEALPGGLFDDLASLMVLDLDDNNLRMLPVGVLTPVLDTLTSLSLENRLRSRIRFEHSIVSIMPTASTVVRVIRTQPHTAVTVALDFGVDITGPAEVTIPAGVTSATFEVTFEGRTINNTRTIALGTVSLPDDTSQDINDGNIAGAVAMVTNLSGAIQFFFTLPDGICDRTPEVQNAIVAAISAAPRCEEVLDSDLNNFTGTLDLNSTGISTLKAGDFDGLTGFTELHLTGNSLSTLPESIFDDARSLERLFLGSNQLTTLSSTVFRNLSPIRSLSLRNNNLATLPDGLFDGLTNITTLDLSGNNLEALPGGLSDILTNVIFLDLSRNNLATLPGGLFNGLNQARNLHLNGNNLNTLSVGVLDPVLDTLTELRLDNVLTGVISFEHAAGAIAQGGGTVVRVVRTQPYTAVTAAINTGGSEGSHVTVPDEIILPAGATSATFEVMIGSASSVNGTATLALGDLSLPADTRDPPNAAIVSAVAVVADTTNVHTLDILPPNGICDRTEQVRNAIVAALGNVANCGVVTEDDLSEFTGRLALQNMGISTLKAGDFDGLTELSNLRLDQNNLSTLPSTVFSDLRNLNRLSLFSNNLSTLLDGLFDNTRVLGHLSLSDNPLTTLSSTVFSNLGGIISLRLESNNLNELPVGIFNSLNRAQILILDNNNLTTLPGGIFSNLGDILNLSLSSNNLNELPGGIFNSLNSVRTLGLSNNNLNELPVGIFNSLNSVRTLGLSNNNLATLPVGVLDPVLDTVANLTLDSTLTDLISFEHAAGAIAQGGSTMVRIVRTQPHTTVTATINTGGNEVSHVTAPGEITLPAGATSATFEVTIDRAASVNGMVTFALGALSLPADTRDPPNADIVGVIAVASADAHALAVTEPGGICDRTDQVQAAIVDAIGSGIVCGNVTDDHLDDLTGSFNFRNMGISTLKAGDFDGLTGLTDLRLNNSTTNPGMPNNIETLPAGLFDDLSSLTILDLSGNNLRTLPAGVFDELAELTALGLNRINLESLNPDVFNNLARLGNLGLAGNNLAALPGGLLDNLPVLNIFRLEDNANPALTELPAGLFDRSPALTWLFLNNTALTSLRADVFNELGSLDRLSITGNAGLTELPAGVLAPVLDTVTRLTLSSTLTGMIFFEDIADDIRRDDRRRVRVIRTQPYAAVAVPVEVGGTEQDRGVTPATVVFPAGATSAFIDVTTGAGAVSGNSILLTLGQPLLLADTRETPDLAIVNAVVTVSLSRGIHTLTVNEFSDICGRTKQVQDAIILHIVPGGTAPCDNILTDFLPRIEGTFSLAATEVMTLKTDDFDDLTGIEELLLNRHNLQALPFGLFDDLSSLVRLDLSDGNNLPVLPGRIFDNLEALTELRLSTINLTTLNPAVFTRLDNLELLHLDRNPDLTLPDGVLDPVLDTLTDLRLDATLRDEIAFVRTGSSLERNASVTISLTRTNPHTTVVVTIAKRGDPDDYFTVPPTVTLPAGMATVTFTVSAGERTDLLRAATLTLSVPSLAADGREPPNQNVRDAIVRAAPGVHSLAGPEPTRVCSRTPQVRDAIVAATGVQCEFVTMEQLAGVAALDLRNTGITTLLSEDFAGLANLESLDLSGNPLTGGLPTGIFDEVLDTLTTLNIDDGLKGNLSIEGPSVVGLRSPAEIIIRRDPAFVAVNVPVNVAFGDGASSADFGGLASRTIRFDNDDTSTVITVATSTAAPGSTLAFTFGTPVLFAAAGSSSTVSADSLILLPDPPGDVHPLTVLGPRVGLEAASEAGETGNRVTIVEPPPDDGNGPNDTAAITITVSSIPAEATGLSLDFTLEISGDSDIFVASGGNTYSPGPGSVTIDGSQITDAGIASTIITITALSDVDGDNETVALTVTGVSFSGAAGDDLSGLSNGVTVLIADYNTGICDRTQQVQNAILLAIPDVSQCFGVTPGHLAGITALTLTNTRIESLKVFDFDGLTNLGSLDLGDTPDLAVLPVGIFDGVLDTLTALNIDDHLKGRLSIEGATIARPGIEVEINILRSPAFVAVEVPINITPGGEADSSDFVISQGVRGPSGRTIGFDNDDTSMNITVFVAPTAPLENGTLTFTFGEIALPVAGGRSSVSADSLILLPAASDSVHTLTLFNGVQIEVNAITEAGEESTGGGNRLTLIEDDNNNGANDMATVTFTFSNLPVGVTAIEYIFNVAILFDSFDAFSLTPPDRVEPHRLVLTDGETTADLDVTLRVLNDDNDVDSLFTFNLRNVQLYASVTNVTGSNIRQLPQSSCGSFSQCLTPPQEFYFKDNEGGICGRTEQVRDAIVPAISGISECFDVTPEHLAGVTTLTFTGIESLQEGDFAGLTNLKRLDLGGNPRLTVLPAGIFDEVLDTLTVLNIDDHLKGRLSIEGPSIIRPGNTARVIVRRSPAFVVVNVPVSVTFGGGADSEDFSGLPDQPIRFDNGNTSVAIAVTAIQRAALGGTATFTFGAPTLPDAVGNLNPISVDSLILLPDPPGGDHTLTVFGTQVNVEAASEAGETGDRLTLVETDFGVDGPNDTAAIMITISNMPEGVDRLEIDYTLEVSGDVSSANIFVARFGNRTNAEQGRVTIGRTRADPPTASTVIRVIAEHDNDKDDETVVLTVTSVTIVIGGIVAADERISGLPSTVTIAIEDNDAGICTRTEQVWETIVSAVEDVSQCYNVTSEHLAGVTALPLANTGIQSLRDGDFAGLANLESLDLSGNSLTGDLLTGIFAGLANLESLDLSGNSLTGDLLTGIFAGLANLESLDLSGNPLTGGLPAGIFDEVLDTLTTLDIDDRLKGRLSIGGGTSVAPGGMARITIVRDPAFVAVNVPVNVAFGGDADRDHFTGLPDQPIRFDNDDTTAVITVSALATARQDSTLSFTFGTSALLAADSSPSGVPANSLILLPDPPGDVHTLTVFGPRVGLEAVSEAGETGNRVTIAEPGADGGGSNDTATITITVGSIPAAATGLSFDYTLEIDGNFTQDTGVSIVGGGNTYNPGPGSVTIARSQFTGANTDTASTVITITALNDVDSDNEDLTLTVTGVSFSGAESENLSGLSGSATVLIGDNAAGICTRTQQVHEAIVSAIPDISHCFNVTPVHLADIITLTLADTGIESLRDDDFAGLTNLESLDLSGNRDLTGLPAGIFGEVQDTLTTLILTNTGIESLQEGVFAGFDALESLDLSGVPLPGGLPVGIFDEVLDTLTELNIDDGLKGRLSIGGGTSVAAGGMAARITIRSSPAFVAVNVPVNIAFGGDAAIEHFTGLPDQPIRFDNDNTSMVITVTALPTAVMDSTLAFTFGTPALLAADSSLSRVSADSLILLPDPPGDVHTLRVFGPRVRLEAVSEAGETGSRVSIVEPDDDGGPNDTATITVTVSNIPEEATGLSFDYTLEISGDSAQSTDVSIVGGGITYNPGPGSVTLDGSQITEAGTASTIITITALNDGDGADEELTLTVTGVSFFGAARENLSGLSSSATILIGDSDENICERTGEVQAEIIRVTGESRCSSVISDDLAGLTALILANAGIMSLKDGDFDGLSALNSLDLSGNSDLTVLPVGIFDEVLDTLTTLNIDDRLKGRLSIEGPSFIRAGSTAEIIVRSSPAFVAVNVPINVTFGGGAVSEHFTGLPDRPIRFDNDDTSTAIAVTASPTAVLDNTATFAFGTPTLLAAGGSTSRVSADSLVLLPDPPGDAHTLTVSETQVNVEAVSEAGETGDRLTIVEAADGGNGPNDTATIMITVSNMPETTTQLVINYTLEISGDVLGDNISVASGGNTYNPGSGSVTIKSARFTNPTTAGTAITVIAGHDEDEDDETVVLTVTGVTVVPGERVSGLPSAVTIVIEDNDAGICTRTRQVHEAIVSAVEGVSQCYNVTPAHLDDITTLTLTSTGIQFLQDGDFAGLTTLESLDLSGNPLNVLPAGIFDGVLDTLTELNIDDRLKGRLSIEGGTSVAPGATVTITIRRSPAFVAVNVPVNVRFENGASSRDFGGLASQTIEFDNDGTSTDIMVTTSPTATREGKAVFTFDTLVFPAFDGNPAPVSRDSLILLPDSPHTLVVGNIVRLRLRVFLEGALQ